MNVVCGSELVVCKRREPVYFSIPISDSDGKYVNTLELKFGYEPADDSYAFFASNNLFKKGWDFKGVVKQISVKPTVDCRKLKAMNHFDRNFIMVGIGMVQLLIWEDEVLSLAQRDIRRKFRGIFRASSTLSSYGVDKSCFTSRPLMAGTCDTRPIWLKSDAMTPSKRRWGLRCECLPLTFPRVLGRMISRGGLITNEFASPSLGCMILFWQGVVLYIMALHRLL